MRAAPENFHSARIEMKNSGKYIFGRRRISAPSLLFTNVFSEVAMNANFNRPVYLKEREGLVREIFSLADAIDFLEEWPEKDRDLVHEAPLKTCYMAHDGHKPLEVARDAVRAFGNKKGILMKQPAVQPWMIKMPSGGGRVSP
jgi:hypothetical protein